MSTSLGRMFFFASVAVCAAPPLLASDYYVATDGSDSNPGTLAQPWGTVKASVNKLSAGDRLYVRSGTYHETDISMTVSGTSGSPITITNYPGETATIDGAKTEFQTPNTGQWVLVDATRNIYRSASTYSSAEFAGLVGGEITASGKTFKLVSYKNCSNGAGGTTYAYQYLSSDFSDYGVNTPRYLGPGACYGDANGQGSYIYIRLTPNPASSLCLSTPYPSWYTDYTNIFYDATTCNPNSYSISIYGGYIGFKPSCNYGVWDGVNMTHHNYSIRRAVASTGNYWTFKNCNLNFCGYGIILNDSSHDDVIDSVVFDGRTPLSLAWSDIKSPDQPADRMRAAGVSFEANCYNITIQNCTLNNLFDGLCPVNNQHDLSILRNTANDIRDDFCQLGTATYNIEIAYNTIKGAGPSHDSSGVQPSGHEGTKYIHHNIIDTSMPVLQNRYNTAGYKSWMCPIPFSSHSGTTNHGDPWRLYNNTVVFGPSASGGVGAWMYSDNADNTTGQKHSVFNNIFHQVASDPWYPNSYSYVMRKWRPLQPWEEYDGNLYNKLSTSTQVLFMEVVGTGGVLHSYQHLSNFLASTDFTNSMTYYTSGWESSGVEADPQLTDYVNGNYRPATGSPALSGAVDISANGWPRATAVGWRGALAGIAGPSDHLVGYWPLDEGTGTLAYDYSGGAHDATLTNGASWITGKVGTHAVSFDNSNDYVSIPNNSDFNFGADTNFAITAWVRVTTPLDIGDVVRKGVGGVGAHRYLIQTMTTGKIMAEIDDNVAKRKAISTNRIDDGNWHFIAVNFDRAGYMTLYVDNSSTWTRTNIDAAGSLDDANQPLTFGGSVQPLAGNIDEVRIYRDRLLTTTEIDTLASQ